MITVHVERTFESFRQRCRELIAGNLAPHNVIWNDADSPQFSLMPPEAVSKAESIKLTVPRRYVDLARLVIAHRDPSRWHLLYSVLWRIVHGERNLLSVHVDSDVMRLDHMRQEIARDIHHMHAFVRFRRVARESHSRREAERSNEAKREAAERTNEDWFVAWYRPDHHILRLAAPFFRDRFASMRWAILTPEESVSWDGTELRYSEGVPSSEAPTDDALESLWSTYYRTTFNPARTNLDLMRQEMPARFWSQMPELQQLPGVLAEAPARLAIMERQQSKSAAPFVPETRDLQVLREAASSCTGCTLHCDATQTVFGEGPSHANVVLIGEQPGDVEDDKGRPFVGPAGDVLKRAMDEAGITREDVYMTNAVKHFKFVRQGKRRIHQTPRMSEVIACKPWLEAELETLKPKAIVLLGATAAKSLLGGTVRITRDAGKVLRTRYAEQTVISVHPSFVLRSQNEEQATAVFKQLVNDLKQVATRVKEDDLKAG